MVPKQLSPTVVLNKATQGTRLANYLIDAVVFYILIFFLGVFLGILSAIGIEAPLRFFMYLDEIPAFDYLFSSILYFIYIFSIEYLTKGKKHRKIHHQNPSCFYRWDNAYTERFSYQKYL